VDRLFLDANILFSAAYRERAGVARLWDLPHVELLSSVYAVEEARTNLPDAGQRKRLEMLLHRVELVPTPVPASIPPGMILPEKDVPIFLAALGARATHLVTGDFRHFGPYFGKIVSGIRIMPPAKYLAEQAGRPGG
jgi:uncharacterized protein